MILIQAIRNAMVNDLVLPKVADLAAVPAGKAGTAGQVTQPGAGPLFESTGKTEGGQG